MDVHLHHPGDCSCAADASPRELPDVAGLTRGMVEGNDAAYRRFYDAYFDRLFRYLLVVTSGNEDATREALQSTLLRVVRHIKVFAEEPAFWNWLTVLARTALADQTRKRSRYLAFLDRFRQHTTIEFSGGTDEDSDERLRALLDRHVAMLPSDERQLVEWKYSQRQSVRAIAEKLGATEKGVESRLSRIRRKLKDAVLGKLAEDQHDRTKG